MFFPIGIVAGILGTIVGLASLISYTALLATGMPAVTANVTNITSQIFIGIGSFFSSVKELKNDWKQALTYFILIFLGGGVGSWVVTFESSKSFSKVVPFFILASAILILWPKKRKNKNEDPAPGLDLSENTSDYQSHSNFHWTTILILLIVFIIGIYCGYFGAASGVIMLALLSITSKKSFPVYNAIRNVSLPAANIFAIIIFVTNTTIHWEIVIPLGLGMLIGGLIGPIIVRHINPEFLKIIIGICAILLSGYLFLQAYHIGL